MSAVQILIIGVALAVIAVLLAVLTDWSWGVIAIFLISEGAFLALVFGNRRKSRCG